MKKYSLDLGFNRESLPNPANRGLPLLQYGLTSIGEVGNSPNLFRHLTKDDTLKITVYDLSKKKKNTVTEMSFMIQFLPALCQKYRSPVKMEFYERFKIFRRENDNYSTVWEETSPTWDVKLSKRAPQFSCNQLQPSGFFNGHVFKLTRPGGFYFTMKLYVKWLGGHSTIFRVDPEMVCSGEN